MPRVEGDAGGQRNARWPPASLCHEPRPVAEVPRGTAAILVASTLYREWNGRREAALFARGAREVRRHAASVPLPVQSRRHQAAPVQTHWNRTHTESERFEVGLAPAKSRYQHWNRHVSPGTTATAPVG